MRNPLTITLDIYETISVMVIYIPSLLLIPLLYGCYYLLFQEGLDDSQAAGIHAVSEVIRYDYHVLYSCSYQAPVLYFRACFLGKSSTDYLEQILEKRMHT